MEANKYEAKSRRIQAWAYVLRIKRPAKRSYGFAWMAYRTSGANEPRHAEHPVGFGARYSVRRNIDRLLGVQ